MKPKKSQMYSHTTLGIFAMIVSSLCFSLMNMCVKFLHDLSPMEIIFFRSIVMVGFLACFWIYKPPNQKAKKKGGLPKLLFRAITGGLSMIALFYNISSIPLGTASAFAQTMPLYAVMFSVIFLKERVRFSTILASIIGFVGVLCICDPSSKSLGADNIIAGIIGGAMMALAFISLRGLKEYYDESVIIMVFGLSMSMIAGVGMFIEIPNLSGFSFPSAKDWVGIFMLGVFGTLGQIFVTRSYMLAPAGIVSPIDYSRILWGVVFGVMMGDALPNLITTSGILLIIISGTMIALPVFLRDYKQIQKQSSV
ncbi:DMT family transporter [uncultured Helicobacter sp.]|uniref:DMT family transporter n=1 Tax=uncultured Helicobacter sp. TaxID=175537 RepID=UPI0027DEA653|nr:DMT family transporter [uncultured Helicobacter sp.]